MQPTKETIAKVFSHYLPCEGIWRNNHCKVLSIDFEKYNCLIVGTQPPTSLRYWQEVQDIQIALTPLSKITDEHAIGLSAILFPDKEFSTREQTIGYVKNSLSYHIRGNGWLGDKYDTGEARFLIKCIKFTNITKAREALQLIGYDLPMLVLGGKTPIEAGIAVDRTTLTKSPATGNKPT